MNPDDPRTNITSKHGRLTMNYGSEQNGANAYSTLGYTFPEKWMRKAHISSLRVFFSGENLLTFTEWPGMDPEITDKMNYYALLRQYSFGLSIKF